MYWQYVLAVIRRAFQPTARLTDVLQILAASAAPAVARFFGVAVPTPDETLAYIGAAVLAFLFLRLFFVAPYQVWREQLGDIGKLKLELSKPERLQLEHMAQLRAKERFELCRSITELFWARLAGDHAVKLFRHCSTAVQPANADDAFCNGVSRLYVYAGLGHTSLEHRKTSTQLLNSLTAYLQGELTAEALALRLPPKPEAETPQ
jgi:hypothetical protein